MSEVCTPPQVSTDNDGEEWAAFGPHHSLADICRWIMQNRSDAEEVHVMMGQMLDGTYGETMQ